MFGQHQLDVMFKDCLVKSSCDHHWGKGPAQTQGADRRQFRPALSLLTHAGALVPRRTGVPARHGQMDAKFIKKDQALTGQARLSVFESGPFSGICFAGAARLFFRDRSSAASACQTALRLKLRRSLVLISWRNSASVRSGLSATISASTSFWSAVSLGGLPPPCGRGARSPVIRRCWSNL